MGHGCVVFGYLVTILGCPRLPVIAKLLLRFSALQPVETHVHSFGTQWGDGIVDDSEGRGVVNLHWNRWFWMSHCDERMAGGGWLCVN